jgi:hypothetical protein
LQDHFIALASPRQGDRSKLEAALSADSARERARTRRARLVHLLAALGLPLWLAAARPGVFSTDFRTLAVTAFAVCLAAVLLALGWEFRCQRARSGLIAALGPLPRRRGEREACAGGREEQS